MARDWYIEAVRLLGAQPTDEAPAGVLLERHRDLLRTLLSGQLERALVDTLRDHELPAGGDDRGFGPLGLLGAVLDGATVALTNVGDEEQDGESDAPRTPGWHASLFEPDGRQIGWGHGESPELALANLAIFDHGAIRGRA